VTAFARREHGLASRAYLNTGILASATLIGKFFDVLSTWAALRRVT
jgi:hypothetical protein